MGGKPDVIAETGLQFFGRMSASISHEIKNVLAIVSENAGLLADYSIMAEEGMPLDPVRLKKMASTVMRQVSRADEITKNMNCLAHSIDDTIADVELKEIIELFMALTDRLTAMRKITVEPKLSGTPVKIKTAPFFLINLLWLCLEFAMAASSDIKQIELITEQTKNGANIRLTQLAGLSVSPKQTFPSERAKCLLGLLAADMAVDAGGGEILLKLPENIERNPSI
jgi:C4-dicarboxylate-specific signal transduction histidine kinase